MLRAAVWEHQSCSEIASAELARELQIDSVIARLLVLRGISTPDLARRFLNPRLEDLHDPFLLTDLALVVDRLLVAIDCGELVAVHGDYDVDGIMSTVILHRIIELLGGKVVHFIPDRLRDGYGLQPNAITRLRDQGVQLIVSVDCGIRSHEAAVMAKQLDMDLLITDHHEPERVIPPALAVVNPKRIDCSYPDKDLAGVGVAFKVVHALCLKTGNLAWLTGFLKLAAIGTVGDVVPLRGENRVIAKIGIDSLTRGPNTVGLQALLEASGVSGKKIGSHEIQFMIAPRINAAGRMSTPELASRLLLSTGKGASSEAKRLAGRLDSENIRRRNEEKNVVEAARGKILADKEIEARKILVVWGDGWHRGVIGIVASKLVEQFFRPTIVLSINKGIAYGSGRSVPGFDLLAAIESCHDLLDRFGGHRQAAGLEMKEVRLLEFNKRLSLYADERLSAEDLKPKLLIDSPLKLSRITQALLGGLSSLEPFGPGNPRPIFYAEGVEVIDGPHSIKDSHLRMTVKQGRSRFRAMAWRAINKEEHIQRRRASLDMVFSLTENTYRGNTSIELSVADVK